MADDTLRTRKTATLGGCLRSMRSMRGITQEAVARAMDIGVAQISDWETDRDVMDDEQLKLYQLAVDHLVRGTLGLQTMRPTTFGECFRRLRELRGFSMGDVARAMRVSVPQISNWELDREPMIEKDKRLYIEVIFTHPLVHMPSHGGNPVPSPDRLVLRLERRVQELLESNTSLVFELRDVDRQRMVREFHTVVVGSTLPERPEIPPEAILRRQLRLITEEYFELMRATFRDVGPGGTHAHNDEKCGLACAESILLTAVSDDPIEVNFPELLDGSLDLDYVVEGLRCWCGIDSRAAWAVLQKSNMAKAGGPRRASDGKMLKPPGWQPPDFAAEIERQKEAALVRQRGPR